MKRHIVILLPLLLMLSVSLTAQEVPADPTVDTRREDLSFLDKIIAALTIEPNKKRAAKDSTLYPAKIIVAPYVLYTPETNVGFGIGGSYQFKLPNSGDEHRTRTSIIPIAMTYTLENQILFYSGFEIFFPDEKWVLSGNIRAQRFPRLFFGVGPETPETNEEIFESVQFVFEPILTKQLFIPKLFLGGGLRYRHVTSTSFERLDEDGNRQPSQFSLAEISGAQGSTSAGVEVAALYDTRNSLLNPQTGSYLEFTHGEYGEVLGGTHVYRLTRADFRKFYLLGGPEDWRDVLGFNVRGYFAEGNVPLVELAQLGSWEIMRGYYEGRYADNNHVAAQAEYRFNFKDSPWGAVAFASVGDVAPEVNAFSLSHTRFAGGAGVRYMVDPKERLNLRLDVAMTGEGDVNFYVQIGEAF